jgi:hypothetical protein
MIDGIIYDTHDCSRRGKRCVYGYWQPPPRRSLAPNQRELFVPPPVRQEQPRTPEQRRADWQRSIDPTEREVSIAPPPRPARRKPSRPQQPPDPPRRKSFFEWLFG